MYVTTVTIHSDVGVLTFVMGVAPHNERRGFEVGHDFSCHGKGRDSSRGFTGSGKGTAGLVKAVPHAGRACRWNLKCPGSAEDAYRFWNPGGSEAGSAS